jgi:hypothetical protein
MCQSLIDEHKTNVFCLDRTEGLSLFGHQIK